MCVFLPISYLTYSLGTSCHLMTSNSQQVLLLRGLYRSSQAQSQDDNKNSKTTITFNFESSEEDGQSRINGFVDKALSLYKERMSEKKDIARYSQCAVV